MKKIKSLLRIVAIPVAYALVLRLFFGINTWNDLFSVMSITFLFCMPTIVGALTIYFSPVEKVKRLSFRIVMPWLPVLVFFWLLCRSPWKAGPAGSWCCPYLC